MFPPFLTGGVHLAQCPQGSSIVAHVKLPFFLRLNDIPLCGSAHFVYLSLLVGT
jgi:hypothetical protein